MPFHSRVNRKPDEPSAARLAAEALFLPQSAKSAPANPCVVIVRKKRVLTEEAAAADADALPPSSNPHAIQAERRPRVFRVESVGLAHDPGATTDVTDGSATLEVPEPAKAVKRRRRQAAPVVIIRPDEPATFAEPALVADAGSSPVKSAQVRIAEQWSGFSLKSLRYPQVAAELARLQELARNLKRQEAEQALRWVQEMVQRYDLRPHDLAL